MRRTTIIGNWKMNNSVSESIRLITELKGLLSGKQEVDIAVAPPFVSLHPAEIAVQGTPIQVAAQNAFFEDNGAYTGEVSPPMLVEIGCRFVILGHSERRQYFKETNDLINKKVRAVLESEMTPVLCIGETKEERKKGKTFEVLENQLRDGLRGLNDGEGEQVVVAYEPIWAIGTGETASPATAQEAHAFIRDKLSAIFRKMVAAEIRIIYGGSANENNIKDLMAQPDIDGALVGGASLNAQSFAKIIQYGE